MLGPLKASNRGSRRLAEEPTSNTWRKRLTCRFELISVGLFLFDLFLLLLASFIWNVRGSLCVAIFLRTNCSPKEGPSSSEEEEEEEDDRPLAPPSSEEELSDMCLRSYDALKIQLGQ